ncbi:MAG TPA: ABC transporter permease [Chloroflexia bacterium]|nr:ABC transporter permease [Chloroflexia bacterium]
MGIPDDRVEQRTAPGEPPVDRHDEPTETRESRRIFRSMMSDTNLLRLGAITVVIFIVMSIARPNEFFSWTNFASMARQFPEIGILAIGVMITLLTGGIDLSVNATANMSGILAALVMTNMAPPGTPLEQVIPVIILAVTVALVTGTLAGLLNGVLIAYVGITPILATLGTLTLYGGIALAITKGPAVYGFPDQFLAIGNATLVGIPIPVIIFTVIAAIFAFMLRSTPYGLKVYLLGTNPTASRFSAIDNTRVLIRTYMLSGLLASIAGVIIIARTNSAKSDYGGSYVLQAILIGILGGVSPAGGFGKISGLVLALLSLQFLSSGFNMLGFSNFFKDFVWGALLLLVMVTNYLSTERSWRWLRPPGANRTRGQPAPG